jgi:hypothetical protein
VHVIAQVKNTVLLPSHNPPTIAGFSKLPESGPASDALEFQGIFVWMISVFLLVNYFTASFVDEGIAQKIERIAHAVLWDK